MTDLLPVPGSQSDVAGILRSGMHSIRGALIELFASVDVDASAPPAVARSVGINRNLAWKLSKIVAADEPLATVEHLPGGPGVDIMLRAFEEYGAPAPATAQVREAMGAFERTVEQHVGDRATLDLMLEHMLPRHLRIERAEAARKLAFRGNSAIWGIQARARLSTMIMAPNDGDPSMVDIANIGGLIGYRRLRPGTRWPLLRLHGYRDDGTAFDTPRLPIDPSVPPGAVPLLHEFCSGMQPEIHAREVAGGVQFELGEGPLGNRGAVTSIFGVLTRRFASVYRDAANHRGEQLVNWYTPVESTVVDLLVHRDLPFAMPPKLDVFGRVAPSWDEGVVMEGRERVELAETLMDLGEGPPALATTLVPGYARMVGSVLERIGWSMSAFAAWRLVVRYPPIPTMAVLSFPLGTRPGEG